MKVLFLSLAILANDQAAFRRKMVEKLAPRNSLYFIFGPTFSLKQIETLVKEKKVTDIAFTGQSEQFMRTLVNNVKKKFPTKEINFYSIAPVDVENVQYVTNYEEIERTVRELKTQVA